ncbi:Proline iminopeptidase [Cucurbita argyrosperma subsp. argyrosperma]|nr:Proline iminopeptidase [Cucurbita argyrosperma subsp. argyrosperma]
MKALLFHSFPSPARSLIPLTRLLSAVHCRSSVRSLAVMAATNPSNGASPPEHAAGTWYSVPELRLRDHYFSVPLNYSLDHSSPKISVYAREVVSVGKEEQPMPYLVYLQGGPGFECPRPTEASGWIQKACEEFRRGTGLSTPLSPSSMSQFQTAEDLANYLKHFRADNIVNDAEFIRTRLVPDAAPWTILGQSYGGFCAVTYLSFAPQGLKQVLITGGIPPIGNGCTADSVYRACFEKIIIQNEKYYKRYPQDVKIVHEVVKYLEENGGGVPLPCGGILTPKGLQTLGLSALGSSTGFERMHYLFERVWDPIIVPGAPKRISYFFLNAISGWLSLDSNPLYGLMHESIYCQSELFATSCSCSCSPKGASSRWSAQRIRNELENKFDVTKAVKEGCPVYFTGEMIFPWMFDEIHALKPFKDAANILAEKEDWPPLYDIAALKNNKVPVAAAVYYEDMYVNFKLAMETASQIAGIRLWVTNEFMHSGLRDGGPQVLDHLMGLLNGKKPLF